MVSERERERERERALNYQVMNHPPSTYHVDGTRGSVTDAAVAVDLLVGGRTLGQYRHGQ